MRMSKNVDVSDAAVEIISLMTHLCRIRAHLLLYIEGYELIEPVAKLDAIFEQILTFQEIEAYNQFMVEHA